MSNVSARCDTLCVHKNYDQSLTFGWGFRRFSCAPPPHAHIPLQSDTCCSEPRTHLVRRRERASPALSHDAHIRAVMGGGAQSSGPPSPWRTYLAHGLSGPVIGHSLSEVVAVGSSAIRDGKGHRAYRRQQAALKRRTRAQNLPCGHGSPSGWGCGESIDTTLPDTHRMSFTADHDNAIANGGSLAGQVLVPMHRSCNSRKSNHAATEIWSAS